MRHTHASLLLRDRVPTEVVSERLGQASPAFTTITYQHVLPGMQDDAQRFGKLLPSLTNAVSIEQSVATPVGSAPVEDPPNAAEAIPQGIASDLVLFVGGGGRI